MPTPNEFKLACALNVAVTNKRKSNEAMPSEATLTKAML